MKLFTIFLCLFSFAAYAEGDSSEIFSAVKKKTVEKLGQPKVTSKNAVKGNQTGGSCKLASDCVEGIKTGETDITCISKNEGTPKANGPGGLKCTCLTSVFACGYAK